MDNFKKPKQGAKVNVRVNKKDQALINLYRESEYTKESSEIEQEIAEKEAEDDIESFIEGHNNPEQTDIPEKDSAKKARKKTAKKEQRKNSFPSHNKPPSFTPWSFFPCHKKLSLFCMNTEKA